MRKIDTLFAAYSESHQTAFNKKIHYFCVPAIFFSLLGLLYLIPVYKLFLPFLDIGIAKHINLATIAIVISVAYYFSLSVRLGVSMLILLVLALVLIHLLELNQFMPMWILMLVVFIIAWIGQFVGHKHEGKKPSFFEDLQFLLVGPAWTLKHLYDRLGVRL